MACPTQGHVARPTTVDSTAIEDIKRFEEGLSLQGEKEWRVEDLAG